MVFNPERKQKLLLRSALSGQLVSDQDINCNVKEKNLYEIFLKLCADNRLLDKIPGLEKSKGQVLF